MQTYGLPGEDASFKQLLAELEALTVGMDGDVEDLIVDDVEAEAMLEAFERGLKA